MRSRRAAEARGTGAHGGPVSAAEEAAQTLFWRRHGRLGTALSLAVILQVVAYALVGSHLQHRHALLALAILGALLTGLAAAVVDRVVTRPWSRVAFYVWSVATVAMVNVGAALDDGDESWLILALFLPLLYAALAYPPAAVMSLGAFSIAGFVVVAATDTRSHLTYPAMEAVTLFLATLMATKSARYREDQRAQLRALTLQLREQATHDTLTGCLNRRGFDDVLEREVARAARYDRPLALLLVDVDRLKSVNDVDGHAAGDRALVAVAGALRAATRRSDLVARIGGDEFAVVAPESDGSDARRLAERIHAELPQRPGATTTVSIGIAACSESWAPADLVHAADLALYAAKNAGRSGTRSYGRIPRQVEHQFE